MVYQTFVYEQSCIIDEIKFKKPKNLAISICLMFHSIRYKGMCKSSFSIDANGLYGRIIVVSDQYLG